MRSTITSRGQTVVPAAIRERFRLGPVDADPIAAFRGSGPAAPTPGCWRSARLSGSGRVDGRPLAARYLRPLALRDNDAGAERVADLLRRAINGQGQVLACFMSRMEVLDRVWKDEDERQARLADAQLQSLPIHCVVVSNPLLKQAIHSDLAELKISLEKYLAGGASA